MAHLKNLVVVEKWAVSSVTRKNLQMSKKVAHK